MTTELAERTRVAALTSRPTTDDDVATVTELRNRYGHEMLGRPICTASQVREGWATPNYGHDDRRLLSTPDAEIAAYAVARSRDPWTFVTAVITTPPEQRTDALWHATFDWVRRHAEELATRAETPDDTRLHLIAPTDDQWLRTHALEAGLVEVRRFHTMEVALTGPVPAPQNSHGAELRSFRRGVEDAAMARCIVDAFATHWGHMEGPFEDAVAYVQSLMDRDTFDPDLLVVACDREEIVGVCWSNPTDGPDEDVGWIGTLGVIPSARRRGIAEALLRESFGRLQRLGKRAVRLGVDAYNGDGAVRLYERAGMQPVDTEVVYELPLDVGAGR